MATMKDARKNNGANVISILHRMSDPAADAVETYTELTAVVTDAFTAIVADPQVVA